MKILSELEQIEEFSYKEGWNECLLKMILFQFKIFAIQFMEILHPQVKISIKNVIFSFDTPKFDCVFFLNKDFAHLSIRYIYEEEIYFSSSNHEFYNLICFY